MLLRTFGGLSLEAEPADGLSASIGPRRLALLALVAAAGPRGITREKILGILWRESDEEQARHALSQALYSLRRNTGSDWITGTSMLRLDSAIRSDVGEFHDALNTDDLARAAVLYTGPFLDGFYLSGAPGFELWVEETRTRVQFAARKALETLARRAVDAGSFGEAGNWWRRLGEMDPFSAAYAVGRIRALSDGGDLAGALRFAQEYESRVRRELEAEPEPVIAELLATLRARAAVPAAAPAPASPASPLPPALATIHDVRPKWSRRNSMLSLAVLALLLTTVLAWRIIGNRASAAAPRFLAVALVQSRDTGALGPVLRDMLATNLARVGGLQVVSNSRLVELLPRAANATRSATNDAARRAGANEVIEGELAAASGGLILTLRRVALPSGTVLQGYTVHASDPYALIDSATAAIAHDLGLDPPADAVATVRTRSTIAYALYEEGLRAFHGSDATGALRLMNAALERDSTFAMAAYFAWLSARIIGRWDYASSILPLVNRLATHAVDRERLVIEGSLAREDEPIADYMRIARELTDRFPSDPDGQIVLGQALAAAGDWAGAVAAFNRAVAIDSVAGATAGSLCRVCSAAHGLSYSYMWWDSAAGAERSLRRLIAFRPHDGSVWGALVEPLLRQGRRAEADSAMARTARSSNIKTNFRSLLDRDLIRSGRLSELEALLISELRTAVPDARGEAPWLLAITLRNQGRLLEAHRLAAQGDLPGSTVRLNGHRDLASLAIIELERGRPREAARHFLAAVKADRAANNGLGLESRYVTWHMTLAGTALAAAGDTAEVRALADSVQRIGISSSFGRDHKLHFFLRGLVSQRQGRHAEAVDAFRRSLFSLTDGYTRTNLELARSLMALQRYPEAIEILRPALRGGVDGSNTYVTHTELREALAQAFEGAGQRDSAAVHYTAVERAWRTADPQFSGRYRVAAAKATPRP